MLINLPRHVLRLRLVVPGGLEHARALSELRDKGDLEVQIESRKLEVEKARNEEQLRVMTSMNNLKVPHPPPPSYPEHFERTDLHYPNTQTSRTRTHLPHPCTARRWI